jgi:hypothetical protein
MKSYTLEMADGSGLSEGHFNSDKDAVAWAVSVLEQRGNDAAELVTGDWESRNPDSLRKLFWADEESAQDDTGANAIAHLVKDDTMNATATVTNTRDTLARWGSVIKCDVEHELELLAEELSSAFPDDHAISLRVEVIKADFLRNLHSLVAELTNRELETLPE